MGINALEKATAYLNMKPHTAKEVLDYLLRKGYEADESEEAVKQLSEYGYIDDYAYAKMYFEYGFEKGRGKDRISRELAGKGIPRDVIDQAYSELDDVPDEREIALQIAAESGSELSEMTYEEKQKLQAKIVRRLASRGFSGSVCYSAAKEAVK